MLSQHGSHDAPTVSPMSLMVFTPDEVSHPLEIKDKGQYMYFEADSIFDGDNQWEDYPLSRMGSTSPMLPYQGTQSPQHTTAYHPIYDARTLDLSYSPSPLDVHSHQTLCTGHMPVCMACTQCQGNSLCQEDEGIALFPSYESTDHSATGLSETPESVFSNRDEGSVQCIEDVSYRFNDSDESRTYYTDSHVQLGTPNPCSPGRGTRKSNNAHSGKTADEIDVEDEEIPYAQLIYKALMSVPSRTMVLSEIYQYFREKIPRFSKMRTKGWQNSIRHNLSMNGAFRKVERPLAPDGSKQRGYYWVLSDEAEKEGVKSTTRFRKNSTSSRRKSSDLDTSSTHKGDIQLSHRRKKTRTEAAFKSGSRKPGKTGEFQTAKSSPSRTPTPESETTVHACAQVKGDPLPDTPALYTMRESTHESSPELNLDANQNFDPTMHPALYTTMWDLQPAISHYYASSYASETNTYDENINSIFNEEFALLQRSQALHPVIPNEYPSLAQWPTQWPLRWRTRVAF